MRIALECEGGRDGNSRTSWWRRGSEEEAGLRVKAGLRGGGGGPEVGLRCGGGAAAARGTPSFTKGESKEIQVDKSRKTSFLSTE